MQLIEDLRFFIGAFFLVVGVLLTGAGLLHPEEVAGVNLNLIVGISFLIFGALSLSLALLSTRRPKR
jgi:hypothetical protein